MCFIYLLIVKVYKGVQILIIKGFNKGALLTSPISLVYAYKAFSRRIQASRTRL
jgi:hypothetical protein